MSNGPLNTKSASSPKMTVPVLMSAVANMPTPFPGACLISKLPEPSVCIPFGGLVAGFGTFMLAGTGTLFLLAILVGALSSWFVKLK